MRRGGAVLPPARGRSGPLGGARDSREPRPQPPAARPDEGTMELEPELLLQEARESVEAAQSYRRELGQRLQGLREARRQVGGPRPQGRCGPRGGRGVPGDGRGHGGLRGAGVSGNSERRREASLKVRETWQGLGMGRWVLRGGGGVGEGDGGS